MTKKTATSQSNRILLLEQREKVVVVPGGFELSDLDADFGGLVLLEQAEGHTPQGGEVLGGIVSARPAVVFVEGHIQYPVQGVLDAPVLPMLAVG